jgi:hypothetical protein
VTQEERIRGTVTKKRIEKAEHSDRPEVQIKQDEFAIYAEHTRQVDFSNKSKVKTLYEDKHTKNPCLSLLKLVLT